VVFFLTMLADLDALCFWSRLLTLVRAHRFGRALSLSWYYQEVWLNEPYPGLGRFLRVGVRPGGLGIGSRVWGPGSGRAAS